MRISVVIPILDDLGALSRLLDRMAGWDRQPDEIIVVAARADPEVRAFADRRGCTLIESPANRGLQLDTGARAAGGDVLWFLHADAAPPDAALDVIESAIAAGAAGGCFRFEFAGDPAWHKRVLARLVGLRIALGGIAYGDQGIFASRSAYAACNGFPHQPLFEEVSLIRCLRGRGAFRVLPLAMQVSTRRWDRDGWLRRTVGNRWLALCYMLGVSAERLARRYGRRAPAQARIER